LTIEGKIKIWQNKDDSKRGSNIGGCGDDF
jgi:hypothetical protein